jgi:hypothetical protein
VKKVWQAGLLAFGCGELAFDPGDLKGEVVYLNKNGGVVTFPFPFLLFLIPTFSITARLQPFTSRHFLSFLFPQFAGITQNQPCVRKETYEQSITCRNQ